MATLPGLVFDRRLLSAAFSAAIHIAVIAVLLLWHFSPAPRETKAAITVVDLPDRPPPDKPPPPPPEPRPTPGAAKAHEAAPAAPRAEAAPLAKAVVPLVTPSFAPAPVPATGTQAASGAALAGMGTGAGGAGNGTGGGGNGSGGSGDGEGEGTEPEVIAGDFKISDYPKELRETGIAGTTWTKVIVGANGRALSCEIERSSGNTVLDDKACEIIMRRHRYRPARNAQGQPIQGRYDFDIFWHQIDLNKN
ncbi:MAG: hypothetical protein JWQ16_1050 [Novosphingobium sp.]|nr:hypothetical protein [Novosphingobium sp.]